MSLPARLLSELLLTLKTDATRRRATDKRSAPRVGIRHPVRVSPAGSAPGEAVTSWIRNLSANGIGLLTRKPLEAGTEFVVPFERGDAKPLHILYRATHLVRLGPELFAVGGRVVCIVEPTRNARANRRAAS